MLSCRGKKVKLSVLKKVEDVYAVFTILEVQDLSSSVPRDNLRARLYHSIQFTYTQLSAVFRKHAIQFKFPC